MSAEPAGAGSGPGDHADRLRWNAKYAAGFVPSFAPHPLAVRVFEPLGALGSPSADLPDGPLAELACGPSGAALLAAANGRRVTAVDVSEIALGMLGDEARRRGLDHLITLVHADLSAWRPVPRSYAVVLCTGFWASAVFTAAAEAVAAGGLLGWEAFTAQARRSRPSLPADWCLAPGEPASLLPPDFTLLDQHDRGQKRQLLARRAPAAVPEPHVPLATTRPTSRSARLSAPPIGRCACGKPPLRASPVPVRIRIPINRPPVGISSRHDGHLCRPWSAGCAIMPAKSGSSSPQNCPFYAYQVRLDGFGSCPGMHRICDQARIHHGKVAKAADVRVAAPGPRLAVAHAFASGRERARR
jgi:hypothetical protein